MSSWVHGLCALRTALVLIYLWQDNTGLWQTLEQLIYSLSPNRLRLFYIYLLYSCSQNYLSLFVGTLSTPSLQWDHIFESFQMLKIAVYSQVGRLAPVVTITQFCCKHYFISSQNCYCCQTFPESHWACFFQTRQTSSSLCWRQMVLDFKDYLKSWTLRKKVDVQYVGPKN